MPKIPDNLIWIVGKGGLLGSSLAQMLSESTANWATWQPKEAFSWKSKPQLHFQFSEAIKDFHRESLNYKKWTLAWTAGVGVIGTQESDLTAETYNFNCFTELLSQTFKSDLGKGVFFLASSAGGIWGGTPHFPISETTPSSPISSYGKQKLAQETLLANLAAMHPQLKVLIGRISNLYGPGQNLTKPQGLLSQLCRSALLQVPINIFVPLNTVRDYIHSQDAAELILKAITKVQQDNYSLQLTTKIFCSEEDCSISQILSYLHQLTYREPVVSFPENRNSHQQPSELTFRSQVLVDSTRCRPLINGIHELLTFLETQLQMGNLPFPEAV